MNEPTYAEIFKVVEIDPELPIIVVRNKESAKIVKGIKQLTGKTDVFSYSFPRSSEEDDPHLGIDKEHGSLAEIFDEAGYDLASHNNNFYIFYYSDNHYNFVLATYYGQKASNYSGKVVERIGWKHIYGVPVDGKFNDEYHYHYFRIEKLDRTAKCTVIGDFEVKLGTMYTIKHFLHKAEFHWSNDGILAIEELPADSFPQYIFLIEHFSYADVVNHIRYFRSLTDFDVIYDHRNK